MRFHIGPLITKVNKCGHKEHASIACMSTMCKYASIDPTSDRVCYASNDGIMYCPPLLPQCLYQLISVHKMVRTTSNSLANMIPSVSGQETGLA